MVLSLQAVVIPKVLSSHLTNNLDRGVRKLLAMWVHVKKELEVAFVFAHGDEESVREQEQGDSDNHGALLQIISVGRFKVSRTGLVFAFLSVRVSFIGFLQ